MSVTITPSISLTAIRTFSTDAAVDSTIPLSGFNVSGPKLTATSTPPVSVESYQEYALVAGALTINLTAILDSLGVTRDCTGLKLQTLIFINPAGNAAINIAPGASDPYPMFGAANDITVPGHATADTAFAFVFPEGCPDVAAAVKTIDFAGTGTQTFKLGIVLG